MPPETHLRHIDGWLEAVDQGPDSYSSGRSRRRHAAPGAREVTLEEPAPRRMKRDHAGGVAREHAIEHQGMDVHVEIQRPAEPLDHGHRAPARLREARGTPLLAQQAEHGAKEHGGHPAAQVVVPGQPLPQPVRQTPHPLPHRDVNNDVVDQVCRAFRHAAATAARTQRPSLARAIDGPVQAAVVAVEPRKAACQVPAPKELPKGTLDESRQAVGLP
jgi:hypothetical protein